LPKLLLLALSYVVFISTIYYTVEGHRKLWALFGLVFGLIYGAVLGANYFILLTGVKAGISNGYPEGIAWFLIGSPNSIPGSLEGFGYGAMALSMFLRASLSERVGWSL
jgi:hypothetical protein